MELESASERARRAKSGAVLLEETPFGEGDWPAISPDGRWIVRHTCDGLRLSRLPDDSDGMLLIPTRYQKEQAIIWTEPAWHPDGRRLALIKREYPGRVLGLYCFDIPTRTAQPLALAEDVAGEIRMPAWLPDEKSVAFFASGEARPYLISGPKSRPQPLFGDQASFFVPPSLYPAHILASSTEGNAALYAFQAFQRGESPLGPAGVANVRPHVSDNARHILYQTYNEAFDYELSAFSLETQERFAIAAITDGRPMARFFPEGRHVIFKRPESRRLVIAKLGGILGPEVEIEVEFGVRDAKVTFVRATSQTTRPLHAWFETFDESSVRLTLGPIPTQLRSPSEERRMTRVIALPELAATRTLKVFAEPEGDHRTVRVFHR